MAACVDSPDYAPDSEPVRAEPEADETTAWVGLQFAWGLPYLLVGETRYVDVVGLDERGGEHSVSAPTFRVEPPHLATVDERGAVTGLAVGDVHVIASYKGFEQKLLVHVESDEPAQLELSPRFVELMRGEEAMVSVAVYNNTDRMLATRTSWRSLNPNVAEVQDGWIRANSRGSTFVWVDAGNVLDTIQVNVVSPPVHRIRTIGPRTLRVGEYSRVSADPLGTDGLRVEDVDIVFASENPLVVEVDPNSGRIYAVAEGVADVVVVADDVTEQHRVEVVGAAVAN